MSSLVALWVMLVAPAATPVTVTVWAVFQLPVVNVTAPATVALVSSELVGVTVTAADGLVSSTTSYSARSPSTTVTDESRTDTPGVSR